MCFTLMQHYIGCGHTDVHFIDCDSREWNPSCRDDGLTGEWRDHSVRKGVAHSYRRSCPTCARVAKERDRDRLAREGLRAWRTFAERHRDADGESESGDDERQADRTRRSRRTEFPFDNFSVNPKEHRAGAPYLPRARREVRDGEVTTRLIERWTRQRTVKTIASSSAQTPSLSGRLSDLTVACCSLPWERKVFPTWKSLHAGPEVLKEQALRSLYENIVASCLVRTPIIGGMTARTVSSIIERTMSNLGREHSVATMWLPALMTADTSFDYMYEEVKAVTCNSDGRVPTDLNAIFPVLMYDYRISRDVMAGNADYDDVYCDKNGVTRTMQLEVQILVLAWCVVMFYHIRLAAQLVFDINGIAGSRSSEYEEAILNLGGGSYTHLIRGLTADDLITAAELVVVHELSRSAESNSSGDSLSVQCDDRSQRHKQLELDRDRTTSSIADTSHKVKTDESAKALESARVLTDLPLYLTGPLRRNISPRFQDLSYQYPQATSLEARYCEEHAGSYPTHSGNVLSKKSPNCGRGIHCHGGRPRPVTCRDPILSSTIQSTLFCFASCGHYNAVGTEGLGLDDDQTGVVAQCGCFEFPKKLLTEQRAFSLRSCLICEQKSASKKARNLANDGWREICLRRQTRVVTSTREIDCWPLELC